MAKQAAQASFESVLDMPGNIIERPKPLPRGTYLTVIQGQPRIDKSSQKQTEFSEFTHKILQAGDDVNEDELEAFLTSADGSKKSISECTIKNTYYHTAESIYRLKDFCKALGIDVEQGNPRQWLAETTGRQCLIHVRHRPWQSGEGVSAEIDRVLSAE